MRLIPLSYPVDGTLVEGFQKVPVHAQREELVVLIPCHRTRKCCQRGNQPADLVSNQVSLHCMNISTSNLALPPAPAGPASSPTSGMRDIEASHRCAGSVTGFAISGNFPAGAPRRAPWVAVYAFCTLPNLGVGDSAPGTVGWRRRVSTASSSRPNWKYKPCKYLFHQYCARVLRRVSTLITLTWSSQNNHKTRLQVVLSLPAFDGSRPGSSMIGTVRFLV
jgi:hypothetical protein